MAGISVFAAQGYGVLYSNPRGSSGYGEKFLRSNIKDWGPGPSSDVLTAVDKTVAQGWTDQNRLFITGGSYAGYLTTWIISHDQRFKAASSQRGVYDLGTFLEKEMFGEWFRDIGAVIRGKKKQKLFWNVNRR